MSEEKFVTIPFSVWEGKYKNMEADNERLRSELAQEKMQPIITAHVRIDGLSRFGYTRHNLWMEVGYLQIHAHTGTYTWPKVGKYVKDDIEEGVKQQIRHMTRYNGTTIFTEDEAKKIREELNEISVGIIKKRDEISEKIKGIPVIIKWLFKIKS